MSTSSTEINTVKRQIVLDIETTGMNQIGAHYKGHKIIEIGAVEIINRRFTDNDFHIYLKPDRLIDPEAFNIHGITNEFLLDKPSFADIASEFIDYIRNAELIIHNASFDIGFINYEFNKLNRNIPKIDTFCKIIDTLALARKIFPGKHNSLDALCSRYEINNTKRTTHSALLDAHILAKIYLTMTSGQTSMIFTENTIHKLQGDTSNINTQNITRQINHLLVILASDEELVDHESYLDLVQKTSGICLWRI